MLMSPFCLHKLDKQHDIYDGQQNSDCQKKLEISVTVKRTEYQRYYSNYNDDGSLIFLHKLDIMDMGRYLGLFPTPFPIGYHL
jgi:hypothetical protein